MKLEEVIVEFQKLGLPAMKERELRLPTDLGGMAVTVVGLRRSGKTYLLYQTIGELLASGVEMKEIFYINFEDNRLEGVTSADLDRIVELYRKHNPKSDVIYLFLDEIQSVPGWELFVRRILERRDARVFISGSSSRLLSREIATGLRGRSMAFRLHTLSFREFMRFRGVRFTEPFIEDERGRILSLLEEYMDFGGFPGIIDYDVPLKIRAMQDYLNLIIFRDLAERYGIEKTGAMKELIRLVVKNFGNRVSIRRLYNILQSSGAPLSRNKVYEYFSHLEDVGFVLPVRKFSYGASPEAGGIAKLYIADIGFAALYSQKDVGRRMENLVALKLMRRRDYLDGRLSVNYWHGKSGREVDFVVSRAGEVEELIQVCYDVEDYSTSEREIKAIVEAAEELGCNRLTVITWEDEGTEERDSKKIEYIPLWKFLLGDGHTHG